MNFTVRNGAVFWNMTTLFLIKGINFFGMECCDYGLQGLWVHPLTWYLDFLQENEFNVMRVPFSQQWVLDGFETIQPSNGMSADPVVSKMTTVQQLDFLFDEAAKRNMFILLDMHRLGCEAQSHELWYSLQNQKYTADTFFSAWQRVLDRYGNRTNLLGIDLLNEPRGLAQWSDDPRFSWNMFVTEAYHRLNYSGLMFVEGVDWGRSFKGMRVDAIKNVSDERIVYSPHIYGPSVTGGSMHSVAEYHAEWNEEFGWLVPENKAVVIGEFGGRYVGSDKEWQDMFVDYLLGLRVPGIFWALNPLSVDTGGLFDDSWTQPMNDKLALLKRLQPHPTIIDIACGKPIGRRKLRGLPATH